VIPLSLGRPPGRPLRLLAIGAHSDDIEIGCGGTILQLLAEAVPLDVHWVVLSAVGERLEEAQRSADAFLAGAERSEVVVGRFRDGFLPHVAGEVKDFFEELKGAFEPDVVLTHTRNDLHQDHRLANELTWNTWRNHLVLEYEVPKYDGDLGAPNVFVPLSEETMARKLELLEEHFASQRDKHWFTSDLFRALARLRGVEAASPSGLAEAFYGRKLTLG
jgi:LmbE family N-acetylglucosaminyl deacetylase